MYCPVQRRRLGGIALNEMARAVRSAGSQAFFRIGDRVVRYAGSVEVVGSVEDGLS